MAEAESAGPGAGPPAAPAIVNSQKVSLGCGTLILIALIVLIFSREGVDKVEKEVRALRQEVAELKESVQAQTEQIKSLQAELAKTTGGR
jgi:septal ring factor EnvC (AmiA/AmiB activator)